MAVDITPEPNDQLATLLTLGEEAWRGLQRLQAEPPPLAGHLVWREERARREAVLDEILREIGAQVLDRQVRQGALDPPPSLVPVVPAPAPDEPPPVEPAPIELPQAPPPRDPERARVLPPKPVQVTPDKLRALQEKMSGGGGFLEAAAQQQRALGGAARLRTAAALLPEIKSRLGSQPRFSSPNDARSELGQLEAVTHEDELRRWEALPQEVRHCLSSLVAARMRALQELAERHTEGLELGQRTHAVFARLLEHRAEGSLDFVHGLAHHHAPTHGKRWGDDADYWQRRLDEHCREYAAVGAPADDGFNLDRAIDELRASIRRVPRLAAPAIAERVASMLRQGAPADEPRLVELMAPHRDILVGRRFKKLRRAIRDRARAGEQAACQEPASWDDWSGMAFTRGKKIMMIGGDPRPEQRARLEGLLACEALLWEDPQEKKVGTLPGITQRIANGQVDIVLVLRDYITHATGDRVIAACKRGGVPFAMVEHGYGGVQIRRAIERYVMGQLPEG